MPIFLHFYYYYYFFFNGIIYAYFNVSHMFLGQFKIVLYALYTVLYNHIKYMNINTPDVYELSDILWQKGVSVDAYFLFFFIFFNGILDAYLNVAHMFLVQNVSWENGEFYQLVAIDSCQGKLVYMAAELGR